MLTLENRLDLNLKIARRSRDNSSPFAQTVIGLTSVLITEARLALAGLAGPTKTTMITIMFADTPHEPGPSSGRHSNCHCAGTTGRRGRPRCRCPIVANPISRIGGLAVGGRGPCGARASRFCAGGTKRRADRLQAPLSGPAPANRVLPSQRHVPRPRSRRNSPVCRRSGSASWSSAVSAKAPID